MLRSVFAACLVLPWLGGCLAWPTAKPTPPTLSPTGSVGHYHFNWKLSGNRAVAPLQIFDDGQHTWLQFPTGQPTPAIFARHPQGDQLLTPVTAQGGLLMLSGVWPHLVLRGGSLQSAAQRLSKMEETSTHTPEAVPTALTATPVVTTVTVPDHTTLPTPEPTPSFQVNPEDGTLRAVLSRWANTAGWRFNAEHWAVGVDLPIVASATFTLPFTQAVQALVASTELSDQPLRPCFYANQVLRIVAQTQPCDRSAAAPGV